MINETISHIQSFRRLHLIFYYVCNKWEFCYFYQRVELLISLSFPTIRFLRISLRTAIEVSALLESISSDLTQCD